MTQRSEEQINRSRQGSIGGLYSRGVVRTRGFVPVRPPEEPGVAPIRTRGAVRTRGKPKVGPWQELKPEELEKMLEELRNAQDGFPITIVAENPQAPETQAFLKRLHEEDLLGADDVLWVVGEGKYDVVLEDLRKDFVSKDAYLNIQEPEDEERAHMKALVDTLTPELLFISYSNAEKLKERLKKWERRVLAVILAGPDDFDPSALDLMLGIPGEDGDRWRRRWPRG